MEKFIFNKKKYKPRNIGKMVSVNDGTRSLEESIMSYEVICALKDLIKYNKNECVLIGGVALSYYIKPRFTQDVDILILNESDMPNIILNFENCKNNTFKHNKTLCIVDFFLSETINIEKHIVKAVFDTARFVDGIKVASPSGLVALKLRRFNPRDRADIYELYKYETIDLLPFHLSNELMKKFIDFVKEEDERKY